MNRIFFVFAVSLAATACGQNSPPNDAGDLQSASKVNASRMKLSGYAVVSRHSIGLVDSCASQSMVSMIVPAGIGGDIEGRKLLDVLYGPPTVYWPGYRVQVEGVFDRRNNSIVVGKVVEVHQADVARNARCEPLEAKK